MILKLFNKYLKVIKESFWIFIGQLFAILGAFVCVKVFTSLLTPSEYGKLALGLTISALISQLIFGPIGNGIIRYYAPAEEKEKLTTYFHSSKRIIVLISLISLLFIPFLVIYFYYIKAYDFIILSILAVLFAIFSGINSIYSGIQNAARQRSIVAFHQGIEPLIRLLMVLILTFLLGKYSYVALAGYLVAIFLVLFSQLFFIRKMIKCKDALGGKEWIKPIWDYSWPFVIWGGFTWSQIASDRWALNYYNSTEEVGLYAALYQIGYYPISIASGMFVQLLTPVFYKRAGDASDISRNRSVSLLNKKITAILVLITIIVFTITFFIHKQIFLVFVNERYIQISYLLPWIVLSGGIFSAGQTLTLDLQCKMNTKILILPKIVSAIIGVVLNFTGACLYGLEGIIIASLIFSVVYSLWIFLLFNKS